MFSLMFLILLLEANLPFEKVASFQVSEYDYFYSGMEYKIIEIDNYIFKYNTRFNQNNEVEFIPFFDTTKSSFKLELPDSLLMKGITSDNLSSPIAYHNNTLTFVYRNKLIQYYKENEICRLVEVINLDSAFNKNIMLYASNLIVDDNYIIGIQERYNKRNKDGVYFYWYFSKNNPDDKKFINLKIPDGYYWSFYQPKNLLDYNNGKFLATDVTKYSIYIYDFNGILETTISRDIPHWSSITKEIIELPNSTHHIIQELQEKDTTRSLIHKVHFIDSNTIFVCYSHRYDHYPQKEIYHLFFDLWYKNSETKEWELIFADIDNKELKENEYLSANYYININYTLIRDQLITLSADFDLEFPFTAMMRKIKK